MRRCLLKTLALGLVAGFGFMGYAPQAAGQVVYAPVPRYQYVRPYAYRTYPQSYAVRPYYYSPWQRARGFYTVPRNSGWGYNGWDNGHLRRPTGRGVPLAKPWIP